LIPLVLASSSPRRRELFALLTSDFTCADSAAPEITAGTAERTCAVNAEAKCRAVAEQHPGATVIGCDTVVEQQGLILGKPRTPDEARDMMLRLQSAAHNVYTGVFILSGDTCRSFVQCTRVVFADIPGDELEAYVLTDEPYDKAGGYGIQGWAAKYVSEIQGDYFNIMGLPVSALYRALRDLGQLPRH